MGVLVIRALLLGYMSGRLNFGNSHMFPMKLQATPRRSKYLSCMCLRFKRATDLQAFRSAALLQSQMLHL